jgi:hypothetical protein
MKNFFKLLLYFFFYSLVFIPLFVAVKDQKGFWFVWSFLAFLAAIMVYGTTIYRWIDKVLGE